MKTLSLSNVLKAIKFTVTRDGRMAAGKFNYYEDATMDAVLSNPTSHFMLNGSLSLPSVAYFGSEKSGALELNNGHYTVYAGSTSAITSMILPPPSAEVLHRTYVLVNQKSSAIEVKFTAGGTTTTVINLSALPLTSAGITTVGNLPINSVTVQCQRTSRALATPQTYTWRIISANYAPAVGASAAAASYYGGIFKVNLLKTTGSTIASSTLSSYITITSDGTAGIPQLGNSNQIIRSFSSSQNVNVSVSSYLPSGYSFSYWQKKSPTPIGSQNTGVPFTQELIGSNTIGNTTITEIDLVFSYTAPITSTTYTYTGGSSYGGSYGGSGFYSGLYSQSGFNNQSF